MQRRWTKTPQTWRRRPTRLRPERWPEPPLRQKRPRHRPVQLLQGMPAAPVETRPRIGSCGEAHVPTTAQLPRPIVVTTGAVAIEVDGLRGTAGGAACIRVNATSRHWQNKQQPTAGIDRETQAACHTSGRDRCGRRSSRQEREPASVQPQRRSHFSRRQRYDVSPRRRGALRVHARVAYPHPAASQERPKRVAIGDSSVYRCQQPSPLIAGGRDA